MEVYRRFMAELSSGGPKVAQSLSEVDVTNPEDVKALITSGGSDILVHFGDEEFLHRYREFEQHLPEWLNQYPKLASADMRYERQVVLEMQPGTPAPLAESPQSRRDSRDPACGEGSSAFRAGGKAFRGLGCGAPGTRGEAGDEPACIRAARCAAPCTGEQGKMAIGALVFLRSEAA